MTHTVTISASDGHPADGESLRERVPERPDRNRAVMRSDGSPSPPLRSCDCIVSWLLPHAVRMPIGAGEPPVNRGPLWVPSRDVANPGRRPWLETDRDLGTACQ
ncbi:hypothetical protein ELS17_17470 [Natrinema altunense]|uniref:Uncharacterized protein n=1 Tax=Natrinema altunense TaxID=222984 RepID=A0A482XX02_9EURY|nr:hypothetical protein ELS17_17470 [Natrinema altunense]